MSQGSMKECVQCSESIPELQLAQHIEDVHVGPVPLEEVRLRCAQCQFSVGRVKLQAMIAHCAKTQHDPGSIELDWRDFAELEQTRTLKIIRMGLELHGNSAKSTPEAFPASPRTLFGNSVAANRAATPTNPIPRSKSFKYESYVSEAEEDLYNSWHDTKAKSVSDLKLNGASPRKSQLKNQYSVLVAHSNGIQEISTPSTSIESVEETLRLQASPPDPKQNGIYQNQKSKSLVQKVLTRKEKGVRRSRDPQILVCQTCTSAMGGSLTILVRHAVLHDRDLLPFLCLRCGARFTRKDRVAEHCSKCGEREGDRPAEWRLEMSHQVRDRILALLFQSFPGIDWVSKCQDRIPGFPLTT